MNCTNDRVSRSVSLAMIALLVLFGDSNGRADDAPDFATQIAPLLERHCLQCHSAGIDKGDLSMATPEQLLEGQLIIPGDANSSYLVELITSYDGEPAEMPKGQPSLSPQSVAMIRNWIDAGAPWPDSIMLREPSRSDASWWSYQPLMRTATFDSIDQFIDAELAEHDLRRRPAADRRTLIRRLTFDLHGLPPSHAAVAEFSRDTAPDAYEKLVDRLLESPLYGERYARHWLDLAHYADTHGFERDQRRENAWRYRDYVIDAFNQDTPYNRFLQEQIAGDVLWPDDPAAIIATGFLAAGPWDFVGQVETASPALRRAARAMDLDDMATQVMTSTMAMTVNCARCHDHKLDPILQKEYFQLQAVFAGVERKEVPVITTTIKQRQSELAQLIKEKAELEIEIGKLQPHAIDLADIVGGGDGSGSGVSRDGIDPRTAARTTENAGLLTDIKTNQFAPSKFPFVDGLFIPDGGDGTTPIPISSTGITIDGVPDTSGEAWDAVRNGPVASQYSTLQAGMDFATEGHSLLGLHANAGITFDLQAIRAANHQDGLTLTANVGYFGESGDYIADASIYFDGEQVAKFPQLRRADGLRPIDIAIPASTRFLTLLSTDGRNGIAHDQICFADPKLQLSSTSGLTSSEQSQLQSLMSAQHELVTQIAELQAHPILSFYGVESLDKAPPVHLLQRGDPESPVGEELAAKGFAALAMLSPELGSIQSTTNERRAALANWITDPLNPLTPRVIVNRLWQWHFGQGIVNTPSDFGFGGDRPSHPELLDWLATELEKREGSLKSMHRLILNSETYKQQSRFTSQSPEIALDADNRLLWRQNAKRMEAEVIRDSVLATTKKLNLQRGGPGFEDFNYEEAYAPIYDYITADTAALWKRTIYRFVVRTTPNPFLTTLDCPDPANLTATRMTTTTPLQSLTLYNNDFMVKQAGYLAQLIEREAGDEIPNQIERAFQITLQRSPSIEEKSVVGQFVQNQSLAAFCRVLFNSNEFLYVD